MTSALVLRCPCDVGAATLTRPFGAISPVKGEVKRAALARHLPPRGRGRTRSVRVRGETPRPQSEHNPPQESA